MLLHTLTFVRPKYLATCDPFGRCVTDGHLLPLSFVRLRIEISYRGAFSSSLKSLKLQLWQKQMAAAFSMKSLL